MNPSIDRRDPRDRKRSDEEQIRGLLTELTVPDVRRRGAACEALCDWFEVHRFPEQCLPDAVNALVGVAVATSERSLQEAALHALIAAGVKHELRLADVAPLVDLLAKLDGVLVDYCLTILSFTHDIAVAPALEAFLDDEDASVREAAADALAELPRRGSGSGELPAG